MNLERLKGELYELEDAVQQQMAVKKYAEQVRILFIALAINKSSI